MKNKRIILGALCALVNISAVFALTKAQTNQNQSAQEIDPEYAQMDQNELNALLQAYNEMLNETEDEVEIAAINDEIQKVQQAKNMFSKNK